MTLAVAIAALVWGSPILFLAFLVCRYWREERQLADPRATAATLEVPPPPALSVVAPTSNERGAVGRRLS